MFKLNFHPHMQSMDEIRKRLAMIDEKLRQLKTTEDDITGVGANTDTTVDGEEKKTHENEQEKDDSSTYAQEQNVTNERKPLITREQLDRLLFDCMKYDLDMKGAADLEWGNINTVL